MELLDAALAFALTLAALATVVTVIMEIVLRSVLMRKRNLVEVMRLVNEELPATTLGLDENERWDFFTRVIVNPAEGAGERLPEKLAEGERAADAIGSIERRSLTGGIYDKVSTEHLLRRLCEIDRVKKMATDAAVELKKELYRLACKYEEFGSAVSADFKRRAQFWSIVFGIVLAVVANVDGLRIFEAYQAKPALTQTVIARDDQIRAAYATTEERRRAIAAARESASKAQAALATARKQHGADSPEAAAAGKQADAAEEALAALSNPAELRAIAADAQQQVASLIAQGVPIGNAYFPHCRIFGANNLSTTCAGPAWPSGVGSGLWAERFGFLGQLLLWLVPVTITGMLIGLGAPFWFDVAKRLAEVRQMFNGTGSNATRLSARDAEGDPRMREDIVSRVVDDAAGATFGAQH